MRPYPEYKDSRHQLIGLVPEHWDVVPNAGFFRVKSIKNTEGEQNLSVYRDYGVIRRDSRDDNHNRVSEDTSNYKLVEVGDFVLNKMKCWMGSLGVSQHRGIVSPSYTVCEPIKEIHRKYFHYLLRSEDYIQIYDSLSYGVRIGQWELRFHDFKKIKSLYPPLSEQQQISNYLDRKTQQIDDLIDKIERKIELLKEQRSSLINQCVTKGLDPNVEMQDSGVEWIGEIPKGWEEKPIKYIAEITLGKMLTPQDKGGMVQKPYLRSKNVQNGHIDTEDINEMWFSPLELNNLRIKFGDLLLSEGGAVGRTSIWENQIEECYIQNSVNKITFSKNYCQNYFFYISQNYFQRKFYDSVVDRVSIPHLTKEKLGNITFVVPPLPEQKQISDHLDRETSKIDRMIDTETKRIELLKEYRQSLISNVVTGKIDVREEVVQ